MSRWRRIRAHCRSHREHLTPRRRRRPPSLPKRSRWRRIGVHVERNRQQSRAMSARLPLFPGLTYLIASCSQTRTHGAVVRTSTTCSTSGGNTSCHLRGVKAGLRLGPTVTVIAVCSLLRRPLPILRVNDQFLMTAWRRRWASRVRRRFDHHITVLSGIPGVINIVCVIVRNAADPHS